MFRNLNIQWKILGIALFGPLIISLVLTWQRIDDIRQGAVEAIISKSAGIVLMAEATRDRMANKLQLGIITPLDQLDPSLVVEAVPIITAMQVAGDKAEEAGYTFRVPTMEPRNPANSPTDLERKVLQEIKSNNLEKKIIIEDNQVRYFKPVRLTKECLYCHGEPKGEMDATGMAKEGWKVGDIHGAFEIISSLDAANRAVTRAKWTVFISTVIILSMITIIVWLVLKASIIKPLSEATDFVRKVADGDMTATISARSKDEIGSMVENLNKMVLQLRTVVREISGTGATLLDSSSELGSLADEFVSGAEKTAEKTRAVASSAEEMSANMSTVAAATEEASTNISLVATATDEMSSNINGIVNSTEKAKLITKSAVDEAGSASEKVDELGRAAMEIGKVTETITEISEQTNLLALNATIEAARAGEAGKGFAVVANEIKELAKQTAEATGEIKDRIDSIQNSTDATVSQIQQITSVINEVDEIVATIVTAVEEQSVTTNEIAENISQASVGIQEVTENVAQVSAVSDEVAQDINEVSQASVATSQGSARMKESAAKLTGLAEQLQKMMARFKV
ncbi:methyl-accepting chemotaxis protein [Desulfolithobacter dissulfuricans]|uniref:Methyl-accepting chemotaxis protein n=1 Tax=Desulfolithobacter dissulfuricans TaxID=2795293 RepID=A0A915TYC9_9BACT|nr:methyl-accepting chemotaxis protein [Desulfolithobacter dissulfuricans]BCO08043.1 methyl-accepting chemotaxis protein [Desulfolithobacter dissulfuricans]